MTLEKMAGCWAGQAAEGYGYGTVHVMYIIKKNTICI